MLIALSAVAYLFTAALCAGAALTALRSPVRRGHAWFWAVAALVFVGLAVMRLYGAEEIWRTMLRQELAASGRYQSRRSIQKVFAGALMLGALAAVVAHVRSWLVNRRRVLQRVIVAASAGLGGMAALVSLRVVSFHQTDFLLYTLRLNLIADPGLTLLVAASGWYYWREARRWPDGGNHAID